jgi:nitrate/nitrite transporter NarK
MYMLNNTIKQSFKALITNRYLTVLTAVTLVLALSFMTYILLNVRPSELQLVTHYTAYGVTHLYRDQWYYLFTFGGFAILIAFFHMTISIKLFLTKGHPLAIMFAWMGIGIIIFAWVTAFSIINVWSPV